MQRNETGLQRAVLERLAKEEDERVEMVAQEVAATQLQKVLGLKFHELRVAAADAEEPKAAPAAKKK